MRRYCDCACCNGGCCFRPHTHNGPPPPTRSNWPLYCNHPNEVPLQCPCDVDCGCRRWGPCRTSPLPPEPEVPPERRIAL